MKKLLFSLFLLAGALLWQSCSKYETYADQVETERNAINNYITKQKIKVISESDFKANDFKPIQLVMNMCSSRVRACTCKLYVKVQEARLSKERLWMLYVVSVKETC